MTDSGSATSRQCTGAGSGSSVRSWRSAQKLRTHRSAARMIGRHQQEIRYCHSVDGTRIAYALAGAGPPLVKAANWLHHLEFDWESPVWRHFFEELTRTHRLLRYDDRGMGLSAWDVTDLGLRSSDRGPGDGRRHGRPGPICHVRPVAGMRQIDRLRGAQPRAGQQARPAWRLRPGLEAARRSGQAVLRRPRSR